jgi:hypothetical protein
VGACGAGPFEDEAVLDWLWDHEELSAPAVRLALDGVHDDREFLDTDWEAAAWGASEVVSAAHEAPRADIDPEMRPTLAVHVAAIRALDFRGRAIQAMGEVRSERSELRRLWDGSDTADWLADTAGLIERLERAPR